jgi:hypothetical protein
MDKKTVKKMEALSEGKKWEGLGDVVASATKKLGIEPCSPCEARRLRLNKMFSFIGK